MFNFKNVGQLKSSYKLTNINKSSIKINPIGVLTPMILNSNETDIRVSESPELQIKDNIKNFLLTNKGERLGRYSFGANLSKYLFDVSSIKKYENTIKEVVEKELANNFAMIRIESIDVITSLSDETILPKMGIDHLTYKKIDTLNKELIPNKDNLQGSLTLLLTIKYSIPQIRVINQGIQLKMLIGG